MKRSVFIELYAGLAAVSLYLCGCKPPVSRIGSKLGYAPAIAKRLGLEPGTVERFVLVDTDVAVVTVLRALTCPDGRAEVVSTLGKWSESQTTWKKLRSERFVGHREAARWLYVTAASRGGIGGFKGRHKLRPSVQGFIPTIASLRRRIERLDLDPAKFEIQLGKAEDVRPFRGAVAYLDPPYAGRQGYGASPEVAPATVYARWARAGAVVALSEGVRLDLPDADVIDLSGARTAQYRRSLTRSSSEFLHIGGI